MILYLQMRVTSVEPSKVKEFLLVLLFSLCKPQFPSSRLFSSSFSSRKTKGYRAPCWFASVERVVLWSRDCPWNFVCESEQGLALAHDSSLELLEKEPGL